MSAAGSPPALEVLRSADRVGALLSPMRQRILQALGEPDSAAGLARRLGLPRQKMNYHLRELERCGLVELAEERQRRGCVERRMRVCARAFVVDPSVAGGLGAEAERVEADRLSSGYLVAAAAAVVRDLGALRDRSRGSNKPLVTSALEAEISFLSPDAFAAFNRELTDAIGGLIAKYHHHGARTRTYRVLVGAYPAPQQGARAGGAASAEDAGAGRGSPRPKPANRASRRAEDKKGTSS